MWYNVTENARGEEMTTEELEKIIKDNLDKPFGNFVALLLYTGMRTEEAAALTWGDIGEDEIHIHSAVDFHGTPKIKEAKTEAETSSRRPSVISVRKR